MNGRDEKLVVYRTAAERWGLWLGALGSVRITLNGLSQGPQIVRKCSSCLQNSGRQKGDTKYPQLILQWPMYLAVIWRLRLGACELIRSYVPNSNAYAVIVVKIQNSLIFIKYQQMHVV